MAILIFFFLFLVFFIVVVAFLESAVHVKLRAHNHACSACIERCNAHFSTSTFTPTNTFPRFSYSTPPRRGNSTSVVSRILSLRARPVVTARPRYHPHFYRRRRHHLPATLVGTTTNKVLFLFCKSGRDVFFPIVLEVYTPFSSHASRTRDFYDFRHDFLLGLLGLLGLLLGLGLLLPPPPLVFSPYLFLLLCVCVCLLLCRLFWPRSLKFFLRISSQNIIQYSMSLYLSYYY